MYSSYVRLMKDNIKLEIIYTLLFMHIWKHEIQYTVYIYIYIYIYIGEGGEGRFQLVSCEVSVL